MPDFYFQDEQGNLIDPKDLGFTGSYDDAYKDYTSGTGLYDGYLPPEEPSFLKNAALSMGASATSLAGLPFAAWGGTGDSISSFPEYLEDGYQSLKSLGRDILGGPFQDQLFGPNQSDINSPRKYIYDIMDKLGGGLSEHSRTGFEATQGLANDIRSQRSTDPSGRLDTVMRGADSFVESGTLMLPAVYKLLKKDITGFKDAIKLAVIGKPAGEDYMRATEAGMSPRDAALLTAEQAIPNILDAAITSTMGLGANAPLSMVFSTGVNFVDEFNRKAIDQKVYEGADWDKLDFGRMTSEVYDSLPEMVGGMAGQMGTIKAGSMAANRKFKVGTQEGPESLEVVATKDVMDKLSEVDYSDVFVDAEPTDTRGVESQIVGEKPIQEKLVTEKERVKATEGEVLKPVAEDVSSENQRKVENLPKEDTVEPLPAEPFDEVARVFQEELFDVARDFRNEDIGAKPVDIVPDTPPPYSERLKALVDTGAISDQAARMLHETVPERVLGQEKASRMQAEIMQKAPMTATQTEIGLIGRQATLFEQIKQTSNLRSDPVDLSVRLNEYQKILSEFESRLSKRDNPFLAGMDTRQFKKYIQDEAINSHDVHGDKFLLQQLDETPNTRKDLRRLARQRIRGKKEGVVDMYNPENVPEGLMDVWGDEEGSLRIFDPKRAMERLQELRPSDISENTMRELQNMRDSGKYDGMPTGKLIPNHLPVIDRFLQGESGLSKSIPVTKIRDTVEAAHAEMRRIYAQPKKILEKSEWGKAVFRAKENQLQEASMRAFKNAAIHGHDYVNLINKDKVVHPILLKRQQLSEQAFRDGKNAVFTEETYQKMAKAMGHNVTPAEIAAIQAYDKSMQQAFKGIVYHAKERIRKAGLDETETAKRLQMVDEWAEIKQRTNYVPMSRGDGNFALQAENPHTGEQYYNRFKTEREQLAVANQLKEMGFDAKPYKHRKPAESAYSLLPDDIMLDIERLIGSDIDVIESLKTDADPSREAAVQGFRSHLLKRKDVLGVPADLEAQFMKYHEGAANLMARWKYKPKIASILDSAAKSTVGGKDGVVTKSPAIDYALKWDKYVDSNVPEAAGLRSFIGHSTLGFLHVPSAMVNMTQNLTNGLPLLIKDMGVTRATKAMTQGEGKYFQYITKPEAFRESNKKLASFLDYAKTIGEFGDAAIDFKMGSKGSGGLQTMTDLSMSLQRLGEHHNRGSMLIAAYENAHHAIKNPTHRQRVEYALDMSKKSNVDYSKTNRPVRARGTGSLAGSALPATYSMKLYGHNWYSNFFDAHRALYGDVKGIAQGKESSAKQAMRDFSSVLTYYGSVGALGGMMAMPFAPALLQVAAATKGVSLEEELHKFGKEAGLGNQARWAMLYGPLMAIDENIGLTFGKTLSPTQDLTFDRSLQETFFNQALGLPGQLAVKAQRWNQAIENPVIEPEGFSEMSYPEKFVAGLQDPFTLAQSPFTPRAVGQGLKGYAYYDRSRFHNIYGNTTIQNPSNTDLLMEALGFQGARKVQGSVTRQAEFIKQARAKARSEGMSDRLGNTILYGDGSRINEIMQDMIRRGMPPSAIKYQLDNLGRNTIRKDDPDFRAIMGMPTDSRHEIVELHNLLRND